MEKKNKLPDKKGFIYLWRKVWNNPIGKRAKYFAIFFFIVSHANWQDKYIIVDNKKKLIKRGQWLGSIKKIAEQFDDISYATTHYIVEYLKVDMMIDTLSTKKYTLFTVINYDKWQGVDMLVDNKLISKLYQIDTTNNINNNNNNKEIVIKQKKYSSLKDIGEEEIKQVADLYQVPLPFVISCYDSLVNYCEAHGKRYKNYLAALRNFVKNDALRIRKEVSEHVSKRGIDARNVK